MGLGIMKLHHVGHGILFVIVNLLFFGVFTIWQLVEAEDQQRYQGVALCFVMLSFLYSVLYGIFAYLGTKKLLYPNLILLCFAGVFFIGTGIVSGACSEMAVMRFMISAISGAGTLAGISLALSALMMVIQKKNKIDT